MNITTTLNISSFIISAIIYTVICCLIDQEWGYTYRKFGGKIK